MSRFLGRSARIVPGPLKAVSAAEGSPVSLTALALTAAAIATGLVLIPHLTQHQPAASPPVAEIALPMPAKPRTVALAEAPAPAEPKIVTAPAAAILPAVEPVAAAEAAPSTPPVESALFQLDALPVLEATGEDLDVSVVAPKPPARPTARRSPGSRSAALSAQ